MIELRGLQRHAQAGQRRAELMGRIGTARALPLEHPVEALRGHAERVGHRVMVMCDGGVRNGYDALKMLALGAKAVLIGRDLIRAGIGGGSEGVKL